MLNLGAGGERKSKREGGKKEREKGRGGETEGGRDGWTDRQTDKDRELM